MVGIAPTCSNEKFITSTKIVLFLFQGENEKEQNFLPN